MRDVRGDLRRRCVDALDRSHGARAGDPHALVCTRECRPAACQCVDGHVRNDDGACVHWQNCGHNATSASEQGDDAEEEMQMDEPAADGGE